MANICFDDKSQRPDAKALAEALGEAAAPWKKLRRELESEWGELVEDWKFYSRKSGWTMKLLLKKRNLFFVTPRRGSVLITS